MTSDVGVLVLAKAPIPGFAKTRVAASVGSAAAADIAAACLLDTLDVVEQWVAPADRVVAISGSLDDAARGRELGARLTSWSVLDQRGDGLGERIFNAHEDAASVWGRDKTVVQIGMDTPSLTSADLVDLTWPVVEGLTDAALGLASDGGWWGLVTTDLISLAPVIDVPMSRPDTGGLTLAGLTAHGTSVGLGRVLVDVDTLDDAMEVAVAIPHSHLAEALARLAGAAR